MTLGRLLALTLVWGSSVATAAALENVKLRRDNRELTIAGELLVEAADGGLLVLAPDGELWTVEPEELVSHKSDALEFSPLLPGALAKQLVKQLPPGFEVHQTKHYLICYATSKEYATWCGALFERLYWAFTNYWTKQGLKLHEPEFPLVALVFGDRQSFANYAAPELKQSAGSIIGYYSLKTNRIVMYDLTGEEAIRAAGDRRHSPTQINAMLARPDAEPMVATIIHEATHQIAFNCGLQTRLADIPLWLSEGLAIYFETPDLESFKGWKKIGAVSASRLGQFRNYLARRPASSLESLLVDDKRLRDPRQALDGYAEAWALNYYLIRKHPKQYLTYLKTLSAKRQLFWDEPAARLKDFKAAFGDDLPRLDADFLKHMQRVH